MRGFGALLWVVFLGHLLIPAGIVVDFLVDQERIAQELCVQRLVPEEMRTCHGHCYLSKKLKEVDARERDLPGTLRALKLDDAVAQRTAIPFRSIVPVLALFRPDMDEALSPGCAPVTEPVPWC